ncbi:MAG: saccharopine dehydrogenase family protein [Actinomycetota bacterium]
MPDVLVFGATGYTGKLVAHALAERGASFAIAGRNRDKLEALAAATGHPDVRVADVADVDSLVSALEDCRVLLTCVGPFAEFGWTAVEAALRAKVHYLDSTGEAAFIGELIERHDRDARSKGIAMAPAIGFDEVPGDVAATLAAEGFDHPDVALTYAIPSSASHGTIKSSLRIVTGRGPWIVDRQQVSISAGQYSRWAPMPPPLGPKPAVSFPLANGYLVPLHIEVNSLRLYITTNPLRKLGLKPILPLLRAGYELPGVRALVERGVELVQRVEGPDERQRQRWWTILAEARSGERWRNVTIMGRDVYGLTAELLASTAMKMAQEDYERSGVLAPVQAADLDWLEKRLLECDCSIETYAPTNAA